MAALVGTLAAMSPAVAVPGSPLARLISLVEVKSLFFATVCCVVLVILAYLTNPSEASFRAFLTELSFRRHLSKLHDPNSDHQDSTATPQNGVHYTSSRRDVIDQTPSANSSLPVTTPLPFRFHFSRRAAVSLRTPAHIFRSFAIFTIAIVTPVKDVEPMSSSTKALCPTPPPSPPSQQLEGTWFIGAFGRWWVGGSVHVNGLEVIDLYSQEEVRAGVISMKSLDRCPTIEGAPSRTNLIVKTSVKPIKVKRRSSVKSSGPSPTEIVLHTSARSSTPPPLPKSASLPLHTPRTPQNDTTRPSAPTPTPSSTLKVATAVALAIGQPSSVLPPAPVEPPLSPPPPTTRARSSSSHLAALDQLPIVADVLRQTAAAQSSVTEVRAQLNAFRTASTSQASLQSAVDVQREKKREDDAVRLELKTKSKAVEDSKRQAESLKRESEKRLKNAVSAKDNAANRIERLTLEIEELQDKMSKDVSSILESGLKANSYDTEMCKLLEAKKKEIKVAEDVVAALALRARELEEKIKEERARLAQAKEEAQAKRPAERRNSTHQPAFLPSSVQMHQLQKLSSAPISPPAQQATMPIPPVQQPFTTNPGERMRFPSISQPMPPPQPHVPSVPSTHGPIQKPSPPHAPGSGSIGPPGLGLLQRRNIPSVSGPEPLNIAQQLPAPTNAVENARPRAVSTSGSLDISGGALIDTTSTSMGYNGFRASIMESRSANANLAFGGGSNGPTPREDMHHGPSAANGSMSRRNSTRSNHRLHQHHHAAPTLVTPNPAPTSTFSPFADSDPIPTITKGLSTPASDLGPISPFASSLIPTSLFRSLEGAETESLTHRTLIPENDEYFPTANGVGAFNGNGNSNGPIGSRSRGNSTNNGSHPSTTRRDSWSSRSGKEVIYNQFGVQQSPTGPPALIPPSHPSPEMGFPSPNLLHASPSSLNGPPFSFGASSNNGLYGMNDTRSTYSLPLLTPQTSRDETHEQNGKPTEVNGGHRRWFTSASSPGSANGHGGENGMAVSTSSNGSGGKPKKSSLNPDAKVFSFKGRSFLLPGLINNGAVASAPTAQTNVSTNQLANLAQLPPPPATSFASRMYGSLVHPHPAQGGQAQQPTTPTSGNFFSSLMAFAPSPAESQALETALGGWGIGGRAAGNGMGRSKSRQNSSSSMTSPFTTSLPSARSSAVDLPLHIAHSSGTSVWEPETGSQVDLTTSAEGSLNPSSSSSSSTSGSTLPTTSSKVPQVKRSFTALWSRSRGRNAQAAAADGEQGRFDGSLEKNAIENGNGGVAVQSIREELE